MGLLIGSTVFTVHSFSFRKYWFSKLFLSFSARTRSFLFWKWSFLHHRNFAYTWVFFYLISSQRNLHIYLFSYYFFVDSVIWMNLFLHWMRVSFSLHTKFCSNLVSLIFRFVQLFMWFQFSIAVNFFSLSEMPIIGSDLQTRSWSHSLFIFRSFSSNF
jgi:hypothetical protein